MLDFFLIPDLWNCVYDNYKKLGPYWLMSTTQKISFFTRWSNEWMDRFFFFCKFVLFKLLYGMPFYSQVFGQCPTSVVLFYYVIEIKKPSKYYSSSMQLFMTGDNPKNHFIFKCFIMFINVYMWLWILAFRAVLSPVKMYLAIAYFSYSWCNCCFVVFFRTIYHVLNINIKVWAFNSITPFQSVLKDRILAYVKIVFKIWGESVVILTIKNNYIYILVTCPKIAVVQILSDEQIF